jgi:hypothetical protein
MYLMKTIKTQHSIEKVDSSTLPSVPKHFICTSTEKSANPSLLTIKNSLDSIVTHPT